MKVIINSRTELYILEEFIFGWNRDRAKARFEFSLRGYLHIILYMWLCKAPAFDRVWCCWLSISVLKAVYVKAGLRGLIEHGKMPFLVLPIPSPTSYRSLLQLPVPFPSIPTRKESMDGSRINTKPMLSRGRRYEGDSVNINTVVSAVISALDWKVYESFSPR